MTEASKRMLMNSLHPNGAENTPVLVVYGGVRPAARTLEEYGRIIVSL